MASAKSRVRFAVLGCGYWGPNIIRNVFENKKCEMVYVSDMRQERLDFIKRRYPTLRVTQGANEAITSVDVDAVIIATPVRTHFELAMASIRAGKHVLIEKPMTETAEQSRKIIRAAKRKGLTLMVDHTFIYTGAVKKLKKIIQKGELGDLLYFDSVRINLGLFQHDVNVLWDLAPHDISIMDHLIDAPVKEVLAVGAAHFKKSLENIGYLTVRYTGTILGHIHVNWTSPVKIRQTIVAGTKKMAVYNDVEPSEKVKIYDKGVDVVRDRDKIYQRLVSYRIGDVHIPQLDQTEALAAEIEHFRLCILRGKTPITDGQAGLRVVDILERARKSLKTGRWT